MKSHEQKSARAKIMHIYTECHARHCISHRPHDTYSKYTHSSALTHHLGRLPRFVVLNYGIAQHLVVGIGLLRNAVHIA